MRLRKVHEGHGLRDKLVLALIRVVLRHPAPGVVRTMLYRADFFGDRMNALTQRVMRGPSSWSVGERELFAAFVSRANRCPY